MTSLSVSASDGGGESFGDGVVVLAKGLQDFDDDVVEESSAVFDDAFLSCVSLRRRDVDPDVDVDCELDGTDLRLLVAGVLLFLLLGQRWPLQEVQLFVFVCLLKHGQRAVAQPEILLQLQQLLGVWVAMARNEGEGE